MTRRTATRASWIVVFASALLACASNPAREPAPFPASWSGVWRGQVDVHRPDGPAGDFVVELEIRPTETPDRWTWTTRFEGPAGSQERPYELLVRDAERGTFAIDEKNGIVLEAQLLDGALVSWFEVAGSHLVTHQELLDAGTASERIRYQILWSEDDATVRTGDTGGTPEVLCHPLATLQSGTLTRVR